MADISYTLSHKIMQPYIDIFISWQPNNLGRGIFTYIWSDLGGGTVSMARSPLCSLIGSRVYVDTISSTEENVWKNMEDKMNWRTVELTLLLDFLLTKQIYDLQNLN